MPVLELEYDPFKPLAPDTPFPPNEKDLLLLFP